jgi:hypothetical protein
MTLEAGFANLPTSSDISVMSIRYYLFVILFMGEGNGYMIYLGGMGGILLLFGWSGKLGGGKVGEMDIVEIRQRLTFYKEQTK